MSSSRACQGHCYFNFGSCVFLPSTPSETGAEKALKPQEEEAVVEREKESQGGDREGDRGKRREEGVKYILNQRFLLFCFFICVIGGTSSQQSGDQLLEILPSYFMVVMRNVPKKK